MKQVHYPESWERRRLKFIANVKTSNVDKHIHDNEIPVRLCNYTDVYYNRVITDDMELSAGSVTPHELNRFGLRRGQVLMTKDSESWDDIAVPAYVSQDMPEVVCGYHLAMVEPLDDELDGEFFCWAAQTDTINDHYKLEARGVTRFGLGHYAMKNVEIGFPSKDRQLAINAYLREKTAEIDDLIAKKRGLLKLLAEKRSALITRAVTRGLDRTAPMKASGIDWLGDIPAHWEVLPIRRVAASVKTGGTPSSSGPDYFAEGTVNWYAPGDFDTLILGQSTKRLRPEAFDDGAAKIFGARSALLVGIGATLGKVGYSQEACSANQQVNAIDANERIDALFLTLFLRSHVDEVRMLANASTIGILNQQKTKSLPVCVPPKNEQAEIIKLALNEFTCENAAAEPIKKTIAALEEYRASIITKAVTGELEVT